MSDRLEKKAKDLLAGRLVGRGQHNLVAFVLDKRGRVISYGFNEYTKTSPVQAKYAAKVGKSCKIYLHAEIAALVKAKGKGDSLFIARFGKNGGRMNAAPCDICSLAIQKTGIKYVTFTVEENNG